jgi:hypothetical protein
MNPTGSLIVWLANTARMVVFNGHRPRAFLGHYRSKIPNTIHPVIHWKNKFFTAGLAEVFDRTFFATFNG